VIYLTADPHFGHANIIRYAERPFADVSAMDDHLIYQTAKTVNPEDVYVCLGDFGRGSAERLCELVATIPARTRILVRGNHDKGAEAMMNAGFSLVVESMVLRLDGHNVLLIHRPVQILPDGIHCVFHGHVHLGRESDLRRAGEFAPIPRFNVNLCVEKTGYCPVPYGWAIKRWKRQMKTGEMT